MAIKQRKPSRGLFKTGVVNMTVTVTRYCLQETVSYVR